MTEAANRLNIFGNRIEPSEYPMVSVLDSTRTPRSNCSIALLAESASPCGDWLNR